MRFYHVDLNLPKSSIRYYAVCVVFIGFLTVFNRLRLATAIPLESSKPDLIRVSLCNPRFLIQPIYNLKLCTDYFGLHKLIFSHFDRFEIYWRRVFQDALKQVFCYCMLRTKVYMSTITSDNVIGRTCPQSRYNFAFNFNYTLCTKVFEASALYLNYKSYNSPKVGHV